MAEIDFILNYNRRALRRERVFKDRADPLAFRDEELISKYRFPKSEITFLLSLIEDDLKRPTRRNHALLLVTQFCAALRFYGKGIFQFDNGDLLGLTQASISNIITNVTQALLRHRNRFIRFPTNFDDQLRIKDGFYRMRGVPNVLGVVDGSHIMIRRPTTGADGMLYVCRKGGHSINAQFICDHEMKFTNVVAKWAGSTKDAFIWRNCSLRAMFERQPSNGYLLGDSAYPLEPWLYTALLQPRTPAEFRHNNKIRGTRYLVENSIGLLKSRFRCLDKSGGILLYYPQKVCKFITVCCMLHNQRRGLHLQEDENLEGVEIEAEDPQPNAQFVQDQIMGDEVVRLRERLIQILRN